MKDDAFVLKLSGSLLFAKKGLDVSFIQTLHEFLRRQAFEKGFRFFLVVSGGPLSPLYRDAAVSIAGQRLTRQHLRMLEVHPSRLNAHFLRILFADIAHPVVIENYEKIQKPKKPIVVFAGSPSSFSTDHDAVSIAKDYNIQKVIKLGAARYIYNKDPRKYKDPTPFKKLSWQQYRTMIGGRWIPDRVAPFDPMAARAAGRAKLNLYYVLGKDIENLRRLLKGEKFRGTTVA